MQLEHLCPSGNAAVLSAELSSAYMVCCVGGTLSHHCFLYAGFDAVTKHAQ
jgi:hypothetical protein